MKRKRTDVLAPASSVRCLTGGVDVGSKTIKTALLAHSATGDEVIAANITVVRRAREASDLRDALRTSWAGVLATAGVSDTDVDYVASTGVRDRVAFRVGHFWGESCQGVGTRFLFPKAVGYLDWGARQLRVGIIDQVGSIVRRLARRAEIDVPAAARASVELLADMPTGPLALIGGRTCDRGWLAALENEMQKLRPSLGLLASEHGIFAGAYGAALVAARRYRRLSKRQVTVAWVPEPTFAPWLN
ncbi:MAG TPA: hypothetical protein VH374_21415 [Polyangia bacterium]|jgi:activator of 2-hydroxyglutaryl-CoA dehydratase|nr:hypothetical protein [Polyangia bacterium]